MSNDLLQMLSVRRGHFRLESGHHGDLWLDLDALFLRPRRLQGFFDDLARRISPYRPDVVCGPLSGGAYVAQAIATRLDIGFVHAERGGDAGEGLYRVAYGIPVSLRPKLLGQRIAVVDDVINAGSAVRATLADLDACGGVPVAIGALLVLGSAAANFATGRSLPLVSVATMPNTLWTPEECPLCAKGVAFSSTR
jgi:orotate phosphoribosyltransferase